MVARVLVCGLVIAAAAGGVWLHEVDVDTMRRLCSEDGVVENLTAAAYALAGLAVLLAARRRTRGRLLYLGHGLLFLFVAGEEISWGQRLLGLQTPEAWQQINEQDETNLHNLWLFHGHVRAVGLLVVFCLCLAIPLANRLSATLRELGRRMQFPVFPLWAAPIPIVAVLLMAFPRLVLGKILLPWDEMGELMLGVGFLLFALELLRLPDLPVPASLAERATRPDVPAS